VYGDGPPSDAGANKASTTTSPCAPVAPMTRMSFLLVDISFGNFVEGLLFDERIFSPGARIYKDFDPDGDSAGT
jgi:hypothetical protein